MRQLDAPKLEDDWSLLDDLGLSFDNEIVAALPGAATAIEQPKQGVAQWAAAIRIVEEASVTLAQKDAEIRDLHSQLEQQRLSAKKEVDLLNAQIRMAHHEVERAFLEAERANKRAVEAENALQRITNALRDGFGSGSRNTPRGAATRRDVAAPAPRQALATAS